ncbi:MAG: PilZ domain-containing protein, partial [Alphaproteobacteria bacterium]|nr:PilZ domain-containing protein [Alphaproteobacteria bacterium]
MTLLGETGADLKGAEAMNGQALRKPVEDPVLAKVRAERRRFRRVRVDLQGRIFLPADSREAACKVVDMSPGGASIECDLACETGTAVVIYIDGFGRFEGTVARRDGFGFGVRFSGTQLKREKTAEQLTLFLNKALVEDAAVMRPHDRTPTKAITQFTRTDGAVVKCEVIVLSPAGVARKTALKPRVGEFVLIGRV